MPGRVDLDGQWDAPTPGRVPLGFRTGEHDRPGRLGETAKRCAVELCEPLDRSDDESGATQTRLAQRREHERGHGVGAVEHRELEATVPSPTWASAAPASARPADAPRSRIWTMPAASTRARASGSPLRHEWTGARNGTSAGSGVVCSEQVHRDPVRDAQRASQERSFAVLDDDETAADERAGGETVARAGGVEPGAGELEG